MATTNDEQQHQQQPATMANGQSTAVALPVTVLDVHHGKPVRLQVKVVVPTNDHPNVNVPNNHHNNTSKQLH